MDRAHEWGKTLAYACDTAHADSLADAFREAGVITHVVHRAAGTDRATVLDHFRRAREPEVLVSTVPTARMRGGDFGEIQTLCKSGTDTCHIFDPLTR